VAPGEYLIYAGTDLDFDSYIGDAGEAMGAYPNLDQPMELSVEDDMENLDFITDYSINFSVSDVIEIMNDEKQTFVKTLEK
jgi:serine protease